MDPYNQSTGPRETRREAGFQEVITSFNEYIIPIPDPKPEDVFAEVPSESPVRYGATETNAADVNQMLQERDLLNKSITHPLIQMFSWDNSCIM